jgi:hypothetical protein
MLVGRKIVIKNYNTINIFLSIDTVSSDHINLKLTIVKVILNITTRMNFL